MSATRASDRVTALSDERALVETVLALDEHGLSVKVVHNPNAAREAASPAFPRVSPS